jgi:predicted enzyme related to lactoylglutathione lyase
LADVNDVKVFVPAQAFGRSLDFYQALGWTLKWKADDESLAELELAGHRIYLQDFFVKDWAWNFMIHVEVDNVEDWEARAGQVAEDFGVKTKAIHDQGYALVTHIWDPSGVLIHFAQLKEDA